MKNAKYIPFLGEDISATIKGALDLSIKLHGRTLTSEVMFEFNGVTLVVDCKQSLDPEYWLHKWETIIYDKQEVYKQSQEYKDAELKREQHLKENQERCDNLMTIFENSKFGNGKALDAWMSEFIPVADNVGVIYNKDLIINTLKYLGYKDAEFVGYKGVWCPDTKQRYIYGQVINCLTRLGCIHPAIVNMIKENK